MAISVAASPIEITFRIRCILSSYPPAARDPDLDLELDCGANNDFGIIKLTIVPLGDWLSMHVEASPIEITFSLYGEAYLRAIWCSSSIVPLTITLHSYGITLESTKKNWIKWSDVGKMDFTVGRSNVAGERPLDWKGWIYRVMKLGSKVIAYGENGVSVLVPVGTTFSMTTIKRIGLYGRYAVDGSDMVHFFIDNEGKLYKLTESLQLLDYSEYLSQLNSSAKITYDCLNERLYICDGVKGFVYNIAEGSMGDGPETITGIGYQSGDAFITSSGLITIEPFEICTDIYDFGSRVSKTVYFMELGVDLSVPIYGAVDYRNSKAGNFLTTPWYLADTLGRVTAIAHGVEFRFRVKTLTYNAFDLDYIKIDGVVNDY